MEKQTKGINATNFSLSKRSAPSSERDTPFQAGKVFGKVGNCERRVKSFALESQKK